MGKNEGAWDRYVRRAQEFIDTGELESFENNYKREIGHKLLAARDAALNDDDDWAVSLKSALRPNQPIAWRNLDDFHQWCIEHSVEALKALQAIWTRATCLLLTKRPLQSSGQRSRGVRTTVASAFLMATLSSIRHLGYVVTHMG